MKRWLLVAALFVTTPAWAQSGGVFEITRSTLDGGGSTERSPDNVVVRGTVGQPDAGATAFGIYYLTGGFWSTQGRLGIFFLDGFESGGTSAWSSTAGETLTAPVPEPAPSTVRDDSEPKAIVRSPNPETKR
ncbi:MAG: hypothetical protein MI919_19710 [Holophagales bacterium]|nr:hypothetical protein [Holophagales bacterium]